MKNRIAVYLASDDKPDSAIMRGLQQADCETAITKSVSETLDKLRALYSYDSAQLVILAAEVQAGAIPLLILLHDILPIMPATLLFDRVGGDIHAVVKALQLGVREYLLFSDPEINRELSARLLAERAGAERQNPPEGVAPAAVEPARSSSPASSESPITSQGQFQWDPIGHVLHMGDSYVRLSPIEGRIFDLLLNNHNRTVSMEELVRNVLSNPNVDVEAGVKQLRPHIVRLRRKLERYPSLSNRILNMRGTGYMFI